MKSGYEIWKKKMNKIFALIKKHEEIISYLFWVP